MNNSKFGNKNTIQSHHDQSEFFTEFKHKTIVEPRFKGHQWRKNIKEMEEGGVCIELSWTQCGGAHLSPKRKTE